MAFQYRFRSVKSFSCDIVGILVGYVSLPVSLVYSKLPFRVLMIFKMLKDWIAKIAQTFSSDFVDLVKDLFNSAKDSLVVL